MRRRDFIIKTALASVATGVLYPFAIEPWRVEVVKISVPLQRLPDAFAGFKLVQISDLHLHPFTTLLQIARVVDKVNQLQPELVVITGDFVTNGTNSMEALMPEILRIEAKHGVVAILGNHDERLNPSLITETLRKAGIDVLRNQGRELQLGGRSLFLAGVDSIISGHPRLEFALAQRQTNLPTILFAHEPDFVDLITPDAGVGLQLSGHSHGGQICLPLLGPPVLPAWGQKYWRGLYRVADTYLYTNRGIGAIGLPVRLGSVPEITEITLTQHSA